eukprot:TRINITY_DN821_c3_g1_i1.p1 TRINITY_DN821_c3_g1~~TRINITY_DN821_c3_g1_i1.p1  ORF type:complete len:838 (+),score=365.12 TRINITY_DN821_c3_g1_i1:61-2574(+)
MTSTASLGSVGIGSTGFGHVLQVLERTGSMRSDGSSKRDRNTKRRLQRNGVQVNVQVPRGPDSAVSPFSPVGIIPSPAHSMPTPNHSQLLLTPEGIGGLRTNIQTSRSSKRTAAEIKAQDLLASAALQFGLGGLASPSAASTFSAFSTCTNPQGNDQVLVWADECPSATNPSYDAAQQLDMHTAALQGLARKTSQADLRGPQSGNANYTPSGSFAQNRLPAAARSMQGRMQGNNPYDNVDTGMLSQFVNSGMGQQDNLTNTRETIQAKHLAQQQILLLRQQLEIQSAEQQQTMLNEQLVQQLLQQQQHQQQQQQTILQPTAVQTQLPAALTRKTNLSGSAKNSAQGSPRPGQLQAETARKSGKEKKIMLGGDEVGSRSPSSQGPRPKSPPPRVSREALTPHERRLVIAIESYLIDEANNKFGGSVPVVVIQRIIQAQSKEDYEEVVVNKYAKSFHAFVKAHETFKLFHYTQDWIDQYQLTHCSTHEGRICFADVSKEALTESDAKTARWKADMWAAVLDDVEGILKKEPVHMKMLMQMFKEAEKVELYSCVLPSNHSLRQLLKKQPERFVILPDAMVKLPEQLTEEEREDWQKKLKELEEKNTQKQQQEAAAANAKPSSPTPSKGRSSPTPTSTPPRKVTTMKIPTPGNMGKNYANSVLNNGAPQQTHFTASQGSGIDVSALVGLNSAGSSPLQSALPLHTSNPHTPVQNVGMNMPQLQQQQNIGWGQAMDNGLNMGLLQTDANSLGLKVSPMPHMASALPLTGSPSVDGGSRFSTPGNQPLQFNNLGHPSPLPNQPSYEQQHQLRYDPNIAHLALKIMGGGQQHGVQPMMQQFGVA